LTENIIVTVLRFENGQDQLFDNLYRGDSWEFSREKDDYPIVNIVSDGKVIASHRSWDNVRFGDALIQELMA
jgi:hypothetical protein